MTSSDDDLLELAAKASGREKRPSSFIPSRLVFESDENAWRLWNPLRNDGDALRLAVQLRLDIEWSGMQVAAAPWGETPWSIEPVQPDAHAATRRAIVRAAAEIGRQQ